MKILTLSTIPNSIEETKKQFNCGDEYLNNYLAMIASQHEKKSICRTYCTIADNRIIAYCSLLSSEVKLDQSVTSQLKVKGLPQHSLPTTRLARLAVDLDFQGSGLGTDLVGHALLKTLNISKEVGCVGCVVDAKDSKSASFYKKLGFIAAPDNPLMLFMHIKTIQDTFLEGAS